MRCKRFMALGILAGIMLCPAHASAQITVTTGKIEGSPGKEVKIPIIIKGVKDKEIKGGVMGMEIRLTYDPALLKFKKPLQSGEVLPNATFDAMVNEAMVPGKVAMAFACGAKSVGSKEMGSVTEDGVVLYAVFTVDDKADVGKKSVLKLDNIRALSPPSENSEAPFELRVNSEDGEFAVVAANPIANLPWLWILSGIGGAIILLLLILLLTRRRGQPQPAGWAGMPPAGGAALPRFTPEGGTFSHRCSRCGGVIQLPSAMMGQKFQCGACGTMQIGGQS